MINLRELATYQYRKNDVRIVCMDGSEIIGSPGEVDDEEESGLDEPGITLYMLDGGWIGVGLSEIDTIEDFIPSMNSSVATLAEA